MGTNKIKTVIAAAIIIMISLAFYVPNVSAMDTAAREFELACKKSTGNITAVRFKNEGTGVTGTLTIASPCEIPAGATASGATGDDLKVKLDNGETITVSTAATKQTLTGYNERNVSTVLSQFGTINRLVLGILPLLLLLTSFAYGALLVTGTGENISDSVKAEVGGLVVLQIVTSFLPSILQFLVTAAGATDGQYGVTGDFGGIIDIIFGVIPIVMVVAIIALIGQRIYREASDRGMMSGAGLA